MLLKISSLVVGYTTPVIGPLSFNLDAGQALGIVGANGCGKSTLLKSFYGQAKIFSGRVERATGTSLASQQQHPARLTDTPVSVLDYLRLLGAEKQNLPDRLAALRHKRIDTLSGGQYQLLAVWACLASSAKVVLLDEPTNNLDPEGVTLLASWLRERRDDRGLLLISHDADFMGAVCDDNINITAQHHSDLHSNGDAAR